ncbi:large ribosomal subunit protein mL65 [Denticeps clupeoides]|uniref:Mitochondrial ribosomal protein S30 n=1 Tax=Denticeps clupeoides TaxID=299321 RepID=A0AAY4CBD1_9TELE|nr:39S ribosomal protein S30, mitochondrial [Denticeps clupeoides]
MAARSRLPFRQLAAAQGPFARINRRVHEAAARTEAAYPPVIPSRTAKSKSAKRQRVAELFERLRAADAQEKVETLTKIQRKKYIVYPQTFALNADRWYQHFTKTAYISGLPPGLSGAAVEDAGVDADALRAFTRSSLLQESWHLKKRRPFLQKEQQQLAAPFLRNLVSGLRSGLVQGNPVLRTSSLDFDPQVSFYWMRGQRIIPRGHQSGRLEPIRFQIEDKPHSQLRTPHQLPELVPLESDISADVPVILSSPDKLPLFRRQNENNIFTGSKLADPCHYGHTQFHLVPDRFRRDKMIKKNLKDQIEVNLRANGISSLFAWTGAQAMYQGFWCGQDLTRPFVSQAVITDGQYFSFFCYQLNTLALTAETDVGNTRKNVCWGTESMPLYESITDDNVIGWNDDVFMILVKFLLNRP